MFFMTNLSLYVTDNDNFKLQTFFIIYQMVILTLYNPFRREYQPVLRGARPSWFHLQNQNSYVYAYN